jgi:hypothetical protein
MPQTHFKKKEKKSITQVINLVRSNKFILFYLDDKKDNDRKWIKI